MADPIIAAVLIPLLPLAAFVLALLCREEAPDGGRRRSPSPPSRSPWSFLGRCSGASSSRRRNPSGGPALASRGEHQHQHGRPDRPPDRAHAGDRHGREPAGADLLPGLHEGGSGLRPVLLLPLPVLLLHARPRPGGQLHPSVHGLGAGRPLLLPPDRVLVPEAGRGARREEGFRRDPLRRFRVSHRHPAPEHPRRARSISGRWRGSSAAAACRRAG